MHELKLSVIQMKCSPKINENIQKAEHLIVQASKNGAQIILLPELFSGPYFCKDQNSKYFDLAEKAEKSIILDHMAKLAEQISVVLPVSFFEKSGRTYFNSVMVIDADGRRIGIYRKSHIPHDPGYWEKFYFTPGKTGFKVWRTKYARIGVGICWDQWFPECARIFALKGAEVIFYPTAIGSDPLNPEYDSSIKWQRVMQGHAVANVIPICASNRVGNEKGNSCTLNFYGKSFITNESGDIIVQGDSSSETFLSANIVYNKKNEIVSNYLFRDRRPDLYSNLLSYDSD